jgi:hypothetical protein
MSGAYSGLSQGTFANLDFELPIPPLNHFILPIANAMPGWRAYIEVSEVDTVAYNTIALDGAAISLHDAGSIYFQPLLGQYSALLQGTSSLVPQRSASLAQIGQVPSDAKSVEFVAGKESSSFHVSFAGQALQLYHIGSLADFNVFAADVSGYAGQSGELRFTAEPRERLLFDAVYFSPAPVVPEPTVASLVGLGGLLYAWHFIKRHKR